MSAPPDRLPPTLQSLPALDVKQDPKTAETELAKLEFEHPMPAAVRKHGKVVDPTILEPGDLILVSAKNPNWFAKKIRIHQAKQFPEQHACWQHAAVSGGRFEICEATLRGVVAHEYWAYMTGQYDLKIRRLKDANGDIRSRLAYYAATAVRKRYGFLAAINLRAILNNGDGWQRPFFSNRGVICSQLYFEACMRVGYLLANVPPENVCPAHLSMSKVMEDVPIKWLKV